jgi:hypothetical protein
MQALIQVRIEAIKVQIKVVLGKLGQIIGESPQVTVAGGLFLGFQGAWSELTLKLSIGYGEPHGIFDDSVLPKEQNFGVVKTGRNFGFHGGRAYEAVDSN